MRLELQHKQICVEEVRGYYIPRISCTHVVPYLRFPILRLPHLRWQLSAAQNTWYTGCTHIHTHTHAHRERRLHIEYIDTIARATKLHSETPHSELLARPQMLAMKSVAEGCAQPYHRCSSTLPSRRERQANVREMQVDRRKGESETRDRDQRVSPRACS